jgi:hypothetical protein
MIQTASQAAMGDPAGRQRGLCRQLEDVLEVYQRPHDPQRPLVCLDEKVGSRLFPYTAAHP